MRVLVLIISLCGYGCGSSNSVSNESDEVSNTLDCPIETIAVSVDGYFDAPFRSEFGEVSEFADDPITLTKVGGPIDYQKFVLSLVASTTQLSQNETEKNLFEHIISTAYAAQCAPQIMIPTNRNITDISIISDVDYSDEFPAGTSLMPIVGIYELTSAPFGPFDPPLEIPQNTQPINAIEYVVSNTGTPIVLHFVFLEAPSSTALHQFTISTRIESDAIATVTSSQQELLLAK